SHAARADSLERAGCLGNRVFDRIRIAGRLQRLRVRHGQTAGGDSIRLPVCERGGGGDAGLAVLSRAIRPARGRRNGCNLRRRGGSQTLLPEAGSPRPVIFAPRAPPAMLSIVIRINSMKSIASRKAATPGPVSSILSASCTFGSERFLNCDCDRSMAAIPPD